MSFLAPLFLIGAAAIALPIVFHLIRRTVKDRVPFSALLFLKPSPPRLTNGSASPLSRMAASTFTLVPGLSTR